MSTAFDDTAGFLGFIRSKWENRLTHSTMLKMFVALIVTITSASATPVHLRCEYRENPLGIDASAPHLSWQSNSAERNWKQSAYQIFVASSLDGLRSGHADVWDSSKNEF